jgi:hypothetical protein
LDFPPTTSYSKGEKKDLYDKWYKMTALFSSKHISFFQDRLPAVKGMAEVLESNLMSQESYILGHEKPDYPTDVEKPYQDGLWEQDLSRGLLWYASDMCNSSRPWSNVPSWSWASLNGTVSYSFLLGLIDTDTKNPDCMISRHPAYNLFSISAPDAPLSASNAPETPSMTPLRLIDAPWKRFDLASHDGSCQMLFDTEQVERISSDGDRLLGVMINKWSPERSEASWRWIGLLLLPAPNAPTFVRVGLVLGPWSAHEGPPWPRDSFEVTA